MFKKRKRSIERQAEAIEEAQEEASMRSRRSGPRRVSSAEFLARVKRIREAGQKWPHGTIQ